jgi:xylose isomerase
LGSWQTLHIDLNDQMPGRYDQDLRFASANFKSSFWPVKFLEDVGYDGPRHFDAHAYRTEDYCGVKDFARGCMRTYLILKEKAARWNADKEIRAILQEISGAGKGSFQTGRYSKKAAAALLARVFDKEAISLPYQRLDQLTVDLLAGLR